MDTDLTAPDSDVAPSVFAFWLVPMTKEHRIFSNGF